MRAGPRRRERNLGEGELPRVSGEPDASKAGLAQLDEVTQGAKPSTQGEGECCGQAHLPSPAKQREAYPSIRPQRAQTPMENKQDSKSPPQLGEETGLLGGGTGVGEAGAVGQGSPRRLQDTMGRGLPVATHSSTAVWCTVRVRFSGPTRITGSL